MSKVKLVTQSEFARMVGVSPQAISKAIKKTGRLRLVEGKIDMHSKLAKEYLNAEFKERGDSQRKKKKREEKERDIDDLSKILFPDDLGDPVIDEEVISLPNAKRLKNGLPIGGKVTIGDLFAFMNESPDKLKFLDKSDLEKLKIMQQTISTYQRNQRERDEFIERKLIQVVFNRLYAIDVNQIRQLSKTLSPSICGRLGIKDPEKIVLVQEITENETFGILKEIQREINDFLTSIGGEIIKEKKK
jgi:transcriptional regulator with XRE-family HTH domain